MVTLLLLTLFYLIFGKPNISSIAQNNKNCCCGQSKKEEEKNRLSYFSHWLRGFVLFVVGILVSYRGNKLANMSI